MENRLASISTTTGAESWRKTTSTIIASQAFRSGNCEILHNSVKVSILTVPLFRRIHNTLSCVYGLWFQVQDNRLFCVHTFLVYKCQLSILLQRANVQSNAHPDSGPPEVKPHPLKTICHRIHTCTSRVYKNGRLE